MTSEEYHIQLEETKIGDPILVTGNSNGNNYDIGQVYVVYQKHSDSVHAESITGSWQGNYLYYKDYILLKPEMDDDTKRKVAKSLGPKIRSTTKEIHDLTEKLKAKQNVMNTMTSLFNKLLNPKVIEREQQDVISKIKEVSIKEAKQIIKEKLYLFSDNIQV